MNDIDALFLASLKYLSYRPRSEKEIRDYLKKKLVRFPDLNNSVIDVIVARLKKQKFLNDIEFAKMWVRSRTEFKPKGKRLIVLELKQKGISQEIIEEVFSQSEKQDDVALVTELLERKKKKYLEMERQERFTKAGSMLARRGFDLDAIKKAIEQVFGK